MDFSIKFVIEFISCYLIFGLCIISSDGRGIDVNQRHSRQHSDTHCFGQTPFHVKVTVTVNSDKETSVVFPDGVLIPSNCTKARTTTVSIDGMFQLDITFSAEISDESVYFGLTDFSIVTKDRNSSVYNDQQISKRNQLRSSGFMSFNTRAGNKTITCKSEEEMAVQSSHAQAVLVFSQVRLQPFTDVNNKLAKVKVCQQNNDQGITDPRHAEIFVPIILATSLTVVLLLLVIGYVVHRKIESTGYVNMD